MKNGLFGKKRFFALAALCLAAALPAMGLAAELRGYEKGAGYQYVTFGSFPQTAQGEVQPILWRVLEVTEDSAYLLSEYVLEARQVHHDPKEFQSVWTDTDLYHYLNGDFLNAAFSREEQEALIQSQDPGTVFLPAYEDIKNKAYGFTKDSTREAFATDYAKSQGIFVYMRTKTSPYWTRTPSNQTRPTWGDYAMRRTMSGGKIGYICVEVSDLGYRPGVLLDPRKVTLTGEGTMESPIAVSVTPISALP